MNNKYYIRKDENNIVIKMFSNNLENPIETDIEYSISNDNRFILLNYQFIDNNLCYHNYDISIIQDIYGNYLFKYVDNILIERTHYEYWDLSKYKEIKIQYISNLSFSKRQELIPDYRLQNISIGITYNENNSNQYLNTINAFRNEYYRLQNLINNADSIISIDNILETINFPNELIQETSP